MGGDSEATLGEVEIMQLPEVLKFVQLLNAFRQIRRVIYVNGEDRMENDVEHSYHLAMLAWYIADASSLGLDTNLVVKYAMIHDLVEVYAGDTYIYSTDEVHIRSKDTREKAARKKIATDFPEFQELHDLIEEYEQQENPESRFVYALDKIHPVINIYLDNGRTWKEKGITLDMLFSHKKDKVAVSPKIKEYFDEIITILAERESELFNVITFKKRGRQ